MPTATAIQTCSKLNRLKGGAVASHQPVIVTGKRENTVLVPEEDWRGWSGNFLSTLGSRHW